MEINNNLLCCVLFATVVSLSSVDAIPEYVDDSLVLQRRNCYCENGRCFTDNEGHMKCACKPGFALQDEFTCKPCDCGSLGQCIFALQPTDGDQFLYQKQCVCDARSAEKDGVCIECFCGDNSACDFKYGERRCFCLDGYAEKDGICTECNCGFDGQCEYENGLKKCECDEGYLEVNGICEECDCGDHGACSFQNGEKTCRCQPGFNVNNGKCDPCDCGLNSEYCGFVNGAKQCMCKDGYSDRYGTCEGCNCGEFSRSCNFNNNQKTCRCLEGFVQKGETCELGCDVENPCQNGGYCNGGFCFCLNGTQGGFCEVIDECSTLCPNQRDTKCSYDVASQKAHCRCVNSELSYYPKRKECKRTCQTDYVCVNGECRNGVCDCIPGTWGDRCEIVDCATDAVNCKLMFYFFVAGRDTYRFIWKGEDTLFVEWKGKLLKFVRTDVVLKVLDDSSAQRVKCDDNRAYKIYWSRGDMVYVPTPEGKFVLYQIENYSVGLARCDSDKRT